MAVAAPAVDVVLAAVIAALLLAVAGSGLLGEGSLVGGDLVRTLLWPDVHLAQPFG